MVLVLNACFLSKNVFTTLIKIHRFVFCTVKPIPIPLLFFLQFIQFCFIMLLQYFRYKYKIMQTYKKQVQHFKSFKVYLSLVENYISIRKILITGNEKRCHKQSVKKVKVENNHFCLTYQQKLISIQKNNTKKNFFLQY